MRTVRFSSPLILLRSYCSKMNSSGLFEVKSRPIRWRSNSHSTYLSAPFQGDKQTMYMFSLLHVNVFFTFTKYVFVPADKAPNNVIIICKQYYIETLIKELGLDNCSTSTGNSTYTSCQMSSEDIVNTHDTFMKSLGIEQSDDDKKLPYLYWTPKLHKSPVKHRFIAGSSRCTTKKLSSLLTKILTVIKTGLEKYCSIIICGYLRIPQIYCHH